MLALTTSELIYYIVSYAWAGIGCSFAPAILLSFYWDRFSPKGVVTALSTGLIITIIWIVTGLGSVVTARAITFIAAMGLSVLITLLSKKEKSKIGKG